MRAGPGIGPLFMVALVSCFGTTHGELVMAPEEPQCHPWPSCTDWTDSIAVPSLVFPRKPGITPKSSRNHLTTFDLSIPGESFFVRLKPGVHYRVEYTGTGASLIILEPGRRIPMPAGSLGNIASASGTQSFGFTARERGDYHFTRTDVTAATLRVRLPPSFN